MAWRTLFMRAACFSVGAVLIVAATMERAEQHQRNNSHMLRMIIDILAQIKIMVWRRIIELMIG